MGLRRGQREATLGCLGRGRGAACGSAKGAEWGCAGAAREMRGNAQGRSVGRRKGRSVGLRRGAAWGCAGVQREAAHGRSVKPRRGAA